MNHFSGACYFVSEESVTASEAAVRCGTMHGGRLASVADKIDLEHITTATAISDEFWIGAYRSETPGGRIVLSDGRRKIKEIQEISSRRKRSPMPSAPSVSGTYPLFSRSYVC